MITKTKVEYLKDKGIFGKCTWVPDRYQQPIMDLRDMHFLWMMMNEKIMILSQALKSKI